MRKKNIWKKEKERRKSIRRKEKDGQHQEASVSGVQVFFPLTGHSRVKDITVVETNYSEFAVIYKHRKFNREFSQVSLYSE